MEPSSRRVFWQASGRTERKALRAKQIFLESNGYGSVALFYNITPNEGVSRRLSVSGIRMNLPFVSGLDRLSTDSALAFHVDSNVEILPRISDIKIRGINLS
jgi:hypothetical protein